MEKDYILASDTNTPLGTHSQSIGVSSRNGSPVPSSPSMSGSPRHVGVSATSLLVDPILALVKAYRLRGAIVGLKQAVCSSFDDTPLSYAYKLLWDSCSSELESLGLQYHARRGSDRHQLSDILFADILLAFDSKSLMIKISSHLSTAKLMT